MKINFSEAVFLLGAFAVPGVSHAIRGGAPISESKTASVGLLEPACTATLIAPDTIITAAHCIRQAGSADYLKFHYVDSSGHPKVLNASKNVAPKMMATLPSQELALVRLDGNADLKDFPELGSETLDERPKPGIIVGFGATETLPVSPSKLGGRVAYSKSRVTIETFADIPMYKTTPADPKTNNLACQGDSGGPLIGDGKLVGVASGYYEADDKFLAKGISGQCQATPWVYYVPIAPYLKWIRTSLRQLHSAQ